MPVLLTCLICKKIFSRNATKARQRERHFCSVECYLKHYPRIKIIKPCRNCGKMVSRSPNACNNNKSKNLFCNHSCAATYNNKHKTHGCRRSKFEIWLEIKLRELYPNLEIIFNGKETINSELDVYFPTLKLAIELNGIFHYEPIYGKEKLKQIKNNDGRKSQACYEHGIEFCIIDISKLSYFKDANAQPYLNIIVDILNVKLGLK